VAVPAAEVSSITVSFGLCCAEHVWAGGLDRCSSGGKPEPAHPGDGEAGVAHGGEGVAGGVAAAGEPRPEGRVGDALHQRQARGVRAGVLEEPHHAAGSQHTSQFGQCGDTIRERTHHQAQHGRIDARLG
jgi:hypothetical protein